METTISLGLKEATEFDRFTRQQIRLLELAKDKPTLRITGTGEIKNVSELESEHPARWLLIEITQDDFHGDCFGKLIATAENAIEFMELKEDLRERGASTFTTYGVSPETNDPPAVIPAFVVVDEWV